MEIIVVFAVIFFVAWLAKKLFRRRFPMALSWSFIGCAILLVSYISWLDWSNGYSRRGMEIVAILMVWGFSAFLAVVGIAVRLWVNHQRKASSDQERQ